MLYRIHAWDEKFENNRSRVIKELAWVPIPNGHDSDGYTEIMEEDNGPEIYCAWILMVQIASKAKPRGTLRRKNGNPHTANTLSRVTRAPKELFDIAIPFLSKQIHWLEEVAGE